MVSPPTDVLKESIVWRNPYATWSGAQNKDYIMFRVLLMALNRGVSGIFHSVCGFSFH
jgi:hypothetical protein